jgi:hypothetical protein
VLCRLLPELPRLPQNWLPPGFPRRHLLLPVPLPIRCHPVLLVLGCPNHRQLQGLELPVDPSRHLLPEQLLGCPSRHLLLPEQLLGCPSRHLLLLEPPVGCPSLHLLLPAEL